MPAYSGTIALIIGVAVQLLGFFGVKLPEDFTGQLTQTIVAVISAISMLIGIWRLLHTKKVADVTAAQLIINHGEAPIVGSLSRRPITDSDRLNAAELVNKERERKAAQS